MTIVAYFFLLTFYNGEGELHHGIWSPSLVKDEVLTPYEMPAYPYHGVAWNFVFRNLPENKISKGEKDEQKEKNLHFQEVLEWLCIVCMASASAGECIYTYMICSFCLGANDVEESI